MSGILRVAAAALLLLCAAPALAKMRTLASGERIDLNRAPVSELMRLPGLGRHRAEAIVAHRARQPFRSPAEVTQVKGIGPAWFEKNQSHLAAGGAVGPVPLTPAPARR